MRSKPNITDAVLLLLSAKPMTPEQITVGINFTDAHPLFAEIRAKWGGEVMVKQVYAAMSGLRSKGQDSRSSIMPEGGEPSIGKMYAITPYGRRELERRGFTGRADQISLSPGKPCKHDPLAQRPLCRECFPDGAEMVDHPAHYGGEDNPYEVIKVIEAWGLGFNLGNTVKYIGRADHKGKLVEDLKKARWYLDREIGNLEKLNARSN